MQIGRSLISKTALLTLLMSVGPMAAAQTGKAWVDPPAETGAAPQATAPASPSPPVPAQPDPAPQAVAPEPAPAAPPPAKSAQPSVPAARPEAPATRQAEQPHAAPPPTPAPQPTREAAADKREAHAAAAKDFAVQYLNSWSAPNDSALEATAEFYAPRVLFHGREVSMRQLFNEKRRFVRRWPERDYRPRRDAVGTVCNPQGEVCTVHAVFDFTATSPKRRRISQGTGALQLVVQFIGDKPLIVAEHSTLLGQERRRNLALEGVSND
jgi:hypothetical protein